MADSKGIYKLKALQQRYISYQLAADMLFAAAIAVLLNSTLYAFFSAAWWWLLPIFFVLFCGISFSRKPWLITLAAIAGFLNRQYPELEESSELVLKPSAGLNILEQLQLAKIENVLQQIPLHQSRFTKRLKFGCLFLTGALLIGYVIVYLYKEDALPGRRNTISSISPKNTVPEKVLPQIASANITITPPEYTHRPQREQDKFAVEIEEGGLVNWKLGLNTGAKQVTLLFNEKEKLPLKSGNGADWAAAKKISNPGFYQVDIDGRLSDLYPVQVIKDNPPVVHIKVPKQYTYIDAGESRKVAMSAVVNDDYGLTDVFINATIARGSGEAVKFKEQKLTFGTSFAQHNREYTLQKTLDLDALGMEPGDELYFYVKAQDNHLQQSRTDVYIISIQDTSELMSMDGLLSGVNVKPEFFRSERQIILDSEQLLKARDSIGTEKFNQRSNELGEDQKLLRLRYGKFLGEEAESAIGDTKADENDPVGNINNFGNAAVVLDKYTDKHDNAEDASFFDPAIKAQLKATLTEMWKAELQLRLYKPQDALPFEYKALRLLKDLQQKSRSYVAKTAYNPPPIKMDKRLTGDLSKITQPVDHQSIKPNDGQTAVLKDAINVLEGLKYSPLLSISAGRSLQLANQQLISKASAQPAVYLPAVGAIKRMLSAGNKINRDDIGLAEKVIQRILPPSALLPGNGQSTADMGLSRGYYKNLNHLNK